MAGVCTFRLAEKSAYKATLLMLNLAHRLVSKLLFGKFKFKLPTSANFLTQLHQKNVKASSYCFPRHTA